MKHQAFNNKWHKTSKRNKQFRFKKSGYISLLLIILMSGQLTAQTTKKYLNIVFIGNSITQGVIIEKPILNSPPAKAVAYLKEQPGITNIKYANQGYAGKTTVDFLPETNTFFPKVLEAADPLSIQRSAQLIFSIVLGTNDSADKGPTGTPVSAESYASNLKTIINELMRLYPEAIYVIHHPIWYSSTTPEYNPERLTSYFPQIDQLVNEYAVIHPEKVFKGDTDGYAYFKENYETRLIPEDKGGKVETFYLHPTIQGAEDLGIFWAKAIYQAIAIEKEASASE